MKKRSFWLSIGVLAAAVWCSGAAIGQTADAALVVSLTGASSYRAEAATQAQPVQAFLRLRRGDAVDVAADARISIAYPGSGMVESWAGPAQFRVGDLRSSGIKGGPDQLQQLPRTLLERLNRAPEVLADLKNRQGLVITREVSRPEPVAVQQARADRQTAQDAGAAASDSASLPELNLFLALYESRQYREADGVIQSLLRQRPADTMVAALAQEFQRVYRRTAP